MRNKHTHRGHCQVCGRVQAVMGNMLAKHGYVVEYGWFNGTCMGSDNPPLQKARVLADKTVATLTDLIASNESRLAQYKAGTRTPELASTGKRERKGREFVEITVPFAEATEYEQRNAMQRTIYAVEGAVKRYKDHLAMLTGRIVEIHGTELIPVDSGKKPVEVKVGMTFMRNGVMWEVKEVRPWGMGFKRKQMRYLCAAGEKKLYLTAREVRAGVK